MTELQKKHREKDLKGRQHFLDDYGKYFITAGTEGLYDDFDLFLTALTNSAATYIVEIKNYENADYPRPYTKFDDYQLDYDKVDKLVRIAETEGRIPILYARFEDLTITWDLRDIPYKERKRMKWTNYDGELYGQRKTQSLQTWLYKEEAKQVKPTN